VQLDFYPQPLEEGLDADKIPPMPRKNGQTGPYRRKARKAAAVREPTNFVRQWRERADMTQEDLAADAGVSLSSISAYERGETDPSIDALKKLSNALGVPRGMILDVNPDLDPPLWAVVLKATAPTKPRK
jgi:DNA-binding XRE family transcriptional regulator